MFDNYKRVFDNLSKLISNRDFHINNTKMKTNIIRWVILLFKWEEKGMFLASLYHELNIKWFLRINWKLCKWKWITI